MNSVDLVVLKTRVPCHRYNDSFNQVILQTTHHHTRVAERHYVDDAEGIIFRKSVVGLIEFTVELTHYSAMGICRKEDLDTFVQRFWSEFEEQSRAHLEKLQAEVDTTRSAINNGYKILVDQSWTDFLKESMAERGEI